jgi:hypothetical protein
MRAVGGAGVCFVAESSVCENAATPGGGGLFDQCDRVDERGTGGV